MVEQNGEPLPHLGFVGIMLISPRSDASTAMAITIAGRLLRSMFVPSFLWRKIHANLL
jgi:hypothetical protein